VSANGSRSYVTERALQKAGRMSLRAVVSVGMVLLFGPGCVTGTAHMLPVAGTPLRAEAEACELACHKLLEPPPTAVMCGSVVEPGTGCTLQASPDRSGYARCLDGCPGARSLDGSSCPDPPLPGLVCEETHKANVGAIIGGTIAVGVIVLALGVVVALASVPVIVL
jgi:hypothetical protein